MRPSRESSAASRLRQILVQRYSLEELELLAADIGVPNWDNLRGTTLIAKAYAIVTWAEREDRLFTLMKTLVEQRPGIDWRV